MQAAPITGRVERVLFVLARAEDLDQIAATARTLRERGGAVTLLVGIRNGEAAFASAAAELGVTDVRWLGDAGARWPGRPPRRYTAPAADLQTGWLESLEAADAGEIAADIAAAIDLTRPDVVVAPGDRDDADRSRIRHAVHAAADVMQVPWYTIEGRDRFRRQRAGAPAFRDYSLASKIVTCVVAALLGAFAGALLTAVHQASGRIGDLPVPWGLIVAVLITVGLLAGLRIVFGTRVAPAAAAAGLLVASALFSVQTAGGSILVPANPVGYIWTFAPVVIAIVVLFWPRVGRTGPPSVGP